jgi:hypothetical protein
MPVNENPITPCGKAASRIQKYSIQNGKNVDWIGQVSSAPGG